MLKNQNGFTLIEMLFVLMIISILLILIVPSFSSKSSGIHDQGCDALVQVVQAQAEMYQLNESKKVTDIQELVTLEYITNDQTTCPNGDKLSIKSGIVQKSGSKE